MCDAENDNIDENNTLNENEKKNIIITGTNNRYLVKRANRIKHEVKKREIMNKYNILPLFLDYNKQLEMLKEIYNKNKNNKNNNIHEKNIIIQELDKKIKGYKQQDLMKKIYNETHFIDILNILENLIKCNMLCFYCKCETYILYENVRELTQWTVDRIDNSLGHNKDNFVVACLNCNIKRRKTNTDKFLFTKQLHLVKKD
jgi:hypothetical protein